jgi:hypothetical protein
MIVARQKKKENIVEYLLYMWQVEDLIRACKFDMDIIGTNIISRYDQPENTMAEIRKWYEELTDMIRQEGVMETGHIQINKNVIIELTDLHSQLLNTPEETMYKSLYYKVLPSIVQLRSKAGNMEIPEIETCFTALYGYLLMKMQGREISRETEDGIKQISNFLAFLAAKYNEDVQTD